MRPAGGPATELASFTRVAAQKGRQQPRKAAAAQRENLVQAHVCVARQRDPATASASAPAFGKCQELKGALTLSGPRERFTPERVRVACRILLAAASRASAALGGNPALFSRGLERLI